VCCNSIARHPVKAWQQPENYFFLTKFRSDQAEEARCGLVFRSAESAGGPLPSKNPEPFFSFVIRSTGLPVNVIPNENPECSPSGSAAELSGVFPEPDPLHGTGKIKNSTARRSFAVSVSNAPWSQEFFSYFNQPLAEKKNSAATGAQNRE